MKIAKLIELAMAVNELRDDINSITAGSEGRPSILLQRETFLELFQTYESTRLCGENGSIFFTTVCGVTFKAVVYDYEMKETA